MIKGKTRIIVLILSSLILSCEDDRLQNLPGCGLLNWRKGGFKVGEYPIFQTDIVLGMTYSGVPKSGTFLTIGDTIFSLNFLRDHDENYFMKYPFQEESKIRSPFAAKFLGFGDVFKLEKLFRHQLNYYGKQLYKSYPDTVFYSSIESEIGQALTHIFYTRECGIIGLFEVARDDTIFRSGFYPAFFHLENIPVLDSFTVRNSISEDCLQRHFERL